MQTVLQKRLRQERKRLNAFAAFLFALLLLCTFALGFVTYKAREGAVVSVGDLKAPVLQGAEGTPQVFPIGVDPKRKLILENALVENYYSAHISKAGGSPGAHTSWLDKIVGKLALVTLYQNLASPSSRILVIQSGERKEEVAQNFGKILDWDAATRKEFLFLIENAKPQLADGKFFPATYVVPRGARPVAVAPLIIDRFEKEIIGRYPEDIAIVVPLQDALTIASLLEREAYDFEDMRHIAGVIWNRLFIDMNLQIDATLQYAKGSRESERWWPRVLPDDKYINSPYNTYENSGLPPGPIANPSLDAILAALNPKETECMYYFHDKGGDFHCAKTYEEHVELLKEYYGRGK